MLLITGKHKKALQEAMGTDDKYAIQALFVDKIMKDPAFKKHIGKLVQGTSYNSYDIRETVENRIITACVDEYLEKHKDKLFEKLSKATLDTLILNRIVDRLVEPKSEDDRRYR